MPSEQPIDGVEQHDLNNELWRYEVDSVVVILFEWAEGSNLYRTAGTATTAQGAAAHDGPAIKDGHFREFAIEDDQSGLIGGYHPHAGRRETHAPSDRFDQPVTLLTGLDHIE